MPLTRLIQRDSAGGAGNGNTASARGHFREADWLAANAANSVRVINRVVSGTAVLDGDERRHAAKLLVNGSLAPPLWLRPLRKQSWRFDASFVSVNGCFSSSPVHRERRLISRPPSSRGSAPPPHPRPDRRGVLFRRCYTSLNIDQPIREDADGPRLMHTGLC